MKIVNVAQRSPEWVAARLGRFTGSQASEMCATIKTGEAAVRRDLRMRLVCERLTGVSQDDTFQSDAMKRGLELEATAFAAYEALTGHVVQRVGFCAHEHPDVLAGCSPDGQLDNFKGLLSLKCPKTTTHVSYMRAEVMPALYVPQMLHELWITGAQYYDFMSFDDRLPADLQTFLIRVPRVQAAVDDYAERAMDFLEEVTLEIDAINEIRKRRAA